MSDKRLPLSKPKVKRKQPAEPFKRTTPKDHELSKAEWITVAHDPDIFPPAKVSPNAYSLVPHTVEFDTMLSLSDIAVYRHMSHLAATNRTTTVDGMSAANISRDIDIHRVTVTMSLQLLVARKHIRKCLNRGPDTYELLSPLFDKWRD